MLRTCLLAAVLVSACHKDATAPAAAGSEHEHEMANLTPELHAFHELLAPRWHAAEGSARMTDTCGAAAQLETAAKTVAAATAPAGAGSDAWTAATTRLVGAVAELETACKSPDLAGFDAAFSHVHEAFHGAMAVTRGEPGGAAAGSAK